MVYDSCRRYSGFFVGIWYLYSDDDPEGFVDFVNGARTPLADWETVQEVLGGAKLPESALNSLFRDLDVMGKHSELHTFSFRRRRHIAARPASPVPSSVMEVGSGTGESVTMN